MIKFTNWSLAELRKRGLFVCFPKLEDELIGYLSILNAADSNTPTKIKEDLRYQYFDFEVLLPDTNEDYDVSWEIDPEKVWEKPVNFLPLNQPNVFSDNSDLTEFRVAQYIDFNETKPVLAALFPPLGKYVIIDGNHRFEAARRRGDEFIPAVILNPAEHVPMMVSEEMRQKYLIHQNLSLILGFAYNPLTLLDLNVSSNSKAVRVIYPFSKGLGFPFYRKAAYLIWNAVRNPKAPTN